MKASTVFTILLAGCVLMGGSFYYVLVHNSDYQLQTALIMKDDLMASVDPIQFAAQNGELWVFPKDPQAWTFSINGRVLQIKPSTPRIINDQAEQTYADLTQAPAWPEIKAALQTYLIQKMDLTGKESENKNVEILTPNPL